jgi:pectate lyase
VTQKSVALLLAQASTALLVQAQPIAFPGAEGFGRFASGGRGGQVIYVTNLNNSGAGSLRAAVTASGPRTVVFAVGGTIQLQSTLRITNGNLTIAGQTAPGGGICLAGYPLDPSGASNVIIRFIRSRLGDTAALENDAFNCRYATDVIIDHCSFSWGIDETATAYDNTRFTMQWCVISESLRDSVHDKGVHGYGGIWGGLGASFHHNLIAHHDSRNPRLNGARYHLTENELVDFRNNVIYNWRSNSCYGGEPASATVPSRQNLINNYYKYGPATASNIRSRILSPSALDGSYGLFHVSGNFVRGSTTITADNWAGGVQGLNSSQLAAIKAENPFSVAPVITQDATDAYPLVLAKAGCVIPFRDPVDARIVQETTNGTTTFTGSRGGLQGIIDSQTDVGGWPLLDAGTAPLDTDGDGMPDAWELANNLNPTNASDRNLTDANGYTRLENYLNSLASAAFPIPEISEQPAAVIIPLGDPFSLSVAASGITPISYQWLKNGLEIDGATSPTYQVTMASSGDAGSYQARVTNPYGTITSEPALVSLTGPTPPSILTGPGDIEVVAGTPAQLLASVNGSPPLSFQWHRGSGQPVPGAVSANLTIHSVSPADAGNYYLVVSNSSGTAISLPARITVQVPITSNTAFSTTFAGNTIHAASPTLTASSTNWHIMSSKNASASSVGDNPATADIETRPLALTMPITSSGIVEAAAFIANPPLDASPTHSSIRTRIVFTPVNVRTVSLGLFNSGESSPYNGLINSQLINTSSTFATGGTSAWRGYRTAIFENSTTYAIDARPPQPETNNTSQALVVPGTSSSFPTVISASNVIPPTTSFNISDNQVHTLSTELQRNSPGSYLLSWILKAGTATIGSGAVTTTVAAAAPAAISSVFDAVAIGYRNRGGSVASTLTIHELEVLTERSSWIANPYEAFLHTHGLAPSTNGAFDQDPDADGIPNGIEFVLGTDPNHSSSQRLPTLTGSAESGWIFSYLRSANATESAEIAIERSSNLFDWQTLTGLQSSLTLMENDMLLETFEIPAGDSSLYLRLKATRK